MEDYKIYYFYTGLGGDLQFILFDTDYESAIKRLEEYYKFEYGEEDDSVKYEIFSEGRADINSPCRLNVLENYTEDDDLAIVFDYLICEVEKLDLKFIKSFRD